MEDFSDKPIGRINTTVYQDTIAEQTAQIYKLYVRVSDLITERSNLEKENVRLLSQIERLSKFDELE